jgi:hypothetical protein
MIERCMGAFAGMTLEVRAGSLQIESLASNATWG